MRALLRGERLATTGIALGLVGVVCLLVASLGLTLFAMQQTRDFREAVYLRCVDRVEYDRASNAAREVQAREWRNLAASEAANPFVSAAIRDARVSSYREMAAATQAAADAQVRSSCAQYRP